MRFGLLLTFLFLPLLRGGELYRQTLTVSGSGAGAAAPVIFAPDTVKGFRLTDAEGQRVPLHLLDRQGGKWTLLFNGKPGTYRLSCTDSPEPNPWVHASSGLIHLYRRYDGHLIRNEDEFHRAWKAAKGEVRGFENNLFLGWNRLGPWQNSLNVYRGYLRIPADGEYYFYTASTDASFLRIDGKTVSSLPGKHGVHYALRGESGGKIFLRKGIVNFEYFHANSRWDYYAVVAYRRPGEKRMSRIPDGWFVPLLKADLKPDPSRLTWKKGTLIDVDGKQMQEVFFSDGTKRVFFPPETFRKNGYAVAIPKEYVPWGGKQKESVALIRLALDQLRREDTSPDGYGAFFAAVHVFDQKTVAEEFHQHVLKYGFGRIRPAEYLNFYETMLFRDRLAGEEYERILKDLEALRSIAPDYAALRTAQIRFYGFRELEKAETEFRRIRRKELSGEPLKDFLLLEADLALWRKGFSEAFAKYNALPSATRKMSDRQKIEADGWLLMLRNALISGSASSGLRALETAEKMRPEIRLDPETAFLKCRLLFLSGRPRIARWYAEASLRMQPSPGTARGALLFLAERDLAEGRKAECLEKLKKILTDHPRSAEAVKAAEMLKKMEVRK